MTDTFLFEAIPCMISWVTSDEVVLAARSGKPASVLSCSAPGKTPLEIMQARLCRLPLTVFFLLEISVVRSFNCAIEGIKVY